MHLKRFDGILLSASLSGCILEFEGEERLIAGFIETTSHMATEAALRSSERLFRSTAETASDALILKKGHIDVESEPGKDTTVHCYLPRSESHIDKSSPATADSSLLNSGQESILLVDDESDLLELTQQQIDELGYTVTTASNGDQALERLAEIPLIDLLFSDVVMPGGMDGHELAQQAQARLPDLKVLLTSGCSNPSFSSRIQPSSRVSLLHKPYSQFDLANRVRLVLDG